MLPSMFTTGLTFHFFTIMDLKSVSNQSAAFIIGLIAFPAFIIPFIARTVIDKYSAKSILQVTTSMMIVSMLFLRLVVNNYLTAIIFILFYGFCVAIQNTTSNVLWPNYFGRTNLGSIRAMATVFMVIGSALGPLPFGLTYDMTGDYQVAIIGNIVFAALALLLAFFITKPTKTTRNDI